jgi:DNA-directed RNA polymerase subunit omega
MFNPDLRNVLKDRTSRYSLVSAVAKRAREISSEAQENEEILNDKPVSIALDEIINGKFVVVEPEEIRNI